MWVISTGKYGFRNCCFCCCCCCCCRCRCRCCCYLYFLDFQWLQLKQQHTVSGESRSADDVAWPFKMMCTEGKLLSYTDVTSSNEGAFVLSLSYETNRNKHLSPAQMGKLMIMLNLYIV